MRKQSIWDGTKKNWLSKFCCLEFACGNDMASLSFPPENRFKPAQLNFFVLYKNRSEPARLKSFYQNRVEPAKLDFETRENKPKLPFQRPSNIPKTGWTNIELSLAWLSGSLQKNLKITKKTDIGGESRITSVPRGAWRRGASARGCRAPAQRGQLTWGPKIRVSAY